MKRFENQKIIAETTLPNSVLENKCESYEEVLNKRRYAELSVPNISYSSIPFDFTDEKNSENNENFIKI